MSWQISPWGNSQFMSSNGVLAVGYKIFTYLAGTTTKESVATSNAGTVFHTNPIILNSIGMPPSPIYLDSDKSYKFVYTSSTDTDPPVAAIYTVDNVMVQPPIPTTSEWVQGTTPTWVNGTQFTVTGDQTLTYHAGRRVKLVASGSTVYGLVESSVYTTSTLITVLVDNEGTISSSLNSVFYSIQSATGTSWPLGYDTGTKKIISVSDSRTSTVALPFEIHARTTGTPAVGIGTGIVVSAESLGEVPSQVGGINFAFLDVTDGSEDSVARILVRRAGAGLATIYQFRATGSSNVSFDHAVTAGRTVTFPDFSFMAGIPHWHPRGTGVGSNKAHNGTVTISANQNLSGLQMYTDFTLNSSVTATVPSGTKFLLICATGTITINGTITATGAGGANGGGGGVAAPGSPGEYGTDNHGGNGGNGGGGGAAGGAAGLAASHGVAVKAQDSPNFLAPFTLALGGGGGGGGGGSPGGVGGAGGKGGGTVILMAPTVILGSASVITTSGNGGSNGAVSNGGGGGGGGAGNVYILCHTYTDNGCAFTHAGGNGGNGDGLGANGGAGGAGVRQIYTY